MSSRHPTDRLPWRSTLLVALCTALLGACHGTGEHGDDDSGVPADDDSVLPDDDAGPDDDTTVTDSDGDGVPLPEDCDDTDAGVFPGALETCDGRDEDCDGTVDEDAADAPTWYADGDGDGYGDPDVSQAACQRPDGWSDVAGDCDDTHPGRYPGAPQVCDGAPDNDCDGTADPNEADADGDGTDPCGGDCDDASPTVYPDAPESCDGRDEDCDGAVDEGLSWDEDADGHFAAGSCEGPSDDCDDGDAGVHPGQVESCDGVDEDCDGIVDDEAGDAGEWYPDADGDGYGTADGAVTSCAPPPDHVGEAGDCDDADATVSPGAEEQCNDGLDNDCDGLAAGCDLTFPTDLASADVIVVNDGEDGSFMWLPVVWDFNLDGIPDLAVPYVKPSDNYSGAIALIAGPIEGEVRLSAATATFTGEAEWDYVSRAARAGDTDGDGNDDLLIGAPNYGEGAVGAAYVLHPPVASGVASVSEADGTLYARSGEPAFGFSVMPAGDVNADGLADVVVGAPFEVPSEEWSYGASYLVHGPIVGIRSVDAADTHFEGTGYTGVDRRMDRAAGVGDLDGDGFGELLLGAAGGAPDGLSSGAFISFGPIDAGLHFVSDGEVAYSHASFGDVGYAVGPGGDVNGDGELDVLVANARGDGSMADGGCFIIWGPVTAGRHDILDAATWVHGGQYNDGAGTSIAGGMDVNGDGRDDVVMGAPFHDMWPIGDDLGAVYLLLSPSGDEVWPDPDDAFVQGEVPFQDTGRQVGLDDVNGDGLGDVLIWSSPNGDDCWWEDSPPCGRAHVFFGRGL